MGRGSTPSVASMWWGGREPGWGGRPLPAPLPTPLPGRKGTTLPPGAPPREPAAQAAVAGGGSAPRPPQAATRAPPSTGRAALQLSRSSARLRPPPGTAGNPCQPSRSGRGTAGPACPRRAARAAASASLTARSTPAKPSPMPTGTKSAAIRRTTVRASAPGPTVGCSVLAAARASQMSSGGSSSTARAGTPALAAMPTHVARWRASKLQRSTTTLAPALRAAAVAASHAPRVPSVSWEERGGEEGRRVGRSVAAAAAAAAARHHATGPYLVHPDPAHPFQLHRQAGLAAPGQADQHGDALARAGRWGRGRRARLEGGRRARQ